MYRTACAIKAYRIETLYTYDNDINAFVRSNVAVLIRETPYQS